MTLRRVGETLVPRGAKPGFDHADVFTRRGRSRMYVAHTGADRVDVFDCANAKYLHALDGHPGVAGVLIDSGLDVMLTTDRGAARLSFFRASDETLVAQFTVGQRPNGVALDTRQLRAYTFDLGDPPGTGCTSTLVDLATSAVLGRIDAGTQRIARAIDVPSAGPHGLALIDGLLFCATDAGELVLLDVGGTVRRRLPLAGVPDVVLYDRDLARVCVAIASPGVVQSFDTRALRPLEAVETEEGVHTIGWDPALKQLWAFAPRSCGAIVYQESA